MKTTEHHPRQPHRGEQGNALMFTIVLTGLIGFVLAAYLTLVQSQNSANVRSQSWNSAMPVVEAGIEDALAHLNKNGATNGSLTTDGWTASSGGFTVTRSVGDAFYKVEILNYAPGSGTNTPIIESKGYVVMPLMLASAANPLPLIAAAGGSTVSYLGRGVRVRTVQDFVFTKGMVARDSVDLHGNNIRTDSFDSTDPRSSTNGMYSSAWARDNGDIAVNSSLTNSLIAGNADIYGHVGVGPGGTIAVGSSGSIGSTAWHQGNNPGIQNGWSKNDMNISLTDVAPPFTGGAFTPSGGWITNTTTTVGTSTNSSTSYSYPSCNGTVTSNNVTTAFYPPGHPGPVTTNYNAGGGVTGYTYSQYTCNSASTSTNTVSTATYYDYILDDGDYQKDNLSGTIYVRGNARLYVTDALNISALVIQSTRSLRLYCAAASASLAGNNTPNSDGTADSFSFWGLPSCSAITFTGSSSFTGTIYAPNAAFTLNGSTNSIDFVGASITRSATLNGHFNFHYDEALRKIGPFRAYIVNSWNEMTPSEVPVITTTLAGSP
jgi:hypothetical protein